jgi:hypothetical protein
LGDYRRYVVLAGANIATDYAYGRRTYAAEMLTKLAARLVGQPASQLDRHELCLAHAVAVPYTPYLAKVNI